MTRQDAVERNHQWNSWQWAIGAESKRVVGNFAGTIDEVWVDVRTLAADEI